MKTMYNNMNILTALQYNLKAVYYWRSKYVGMKNACEQALSERYQLKQEVKMLKERIAYNSFITYTLK